MSEFHNHSHYIQDNGHCHSHEFPVSCACKECCQAFAHRHSFTPGSTRCLQAVSFIQKLGVRKYVPGELHYAGIVYEDEFGRLFQIVCKDRDSGACSHTHSCDHCQYAESFTL